MRHPRFRLISGLILTVVVLAPAAAVSAQTQTVTVTPPSQSAEDVREDLMKLLERYPPSLPRVLKLDPALMSNDAYLAPYPGLVAFLTQHPEVKRNPAYYLERVPGGNYGGSYRSEAQEMWEGVMAGVAVFVVLVTMLSALGWIVRTLVDYRRWHRLSKVQAEAHAKLLDRFTANDELIAYVQSPAGSRFLQSAPIALDAGARAAGAPFGRILWSIQAGLVLAAAGLGLYYVSWQLTEEVRQPLYTLGVLALSLGGGFVASAIVSFFLSKRLGLFDPQGPALPITHRDSQGV